jgi:response regulator NasT
MMRLRIAIADDEADMREFLERMLPRCGHEVVAIAENGRQLVELSRAVEPDLILTDIKMPELDGIEASNQICAERPLPIIFISAHHDAALIERAEADHALAYLVKPISFADLQPAISIAMRRFQELQAVRQECENLKQAWTDRKVIEQAKESIMKVVNSIDDNEAFRRLQALAAESNIKLVEAARRVVSVEKVFSRSSIN